MSVDRSVNFTGIPFENPFLLSSAPPTESESNILRAFEAGWGGVVTKTIGLHPVVNVVGAKAKFMRTTPDDAYVSMKKRPGAALHSSWNWELISDKTLDWWLPRIRRIKEAFPGRVLIASIMAGLRHRQGAAELAAAGPRVPGRRRGRAGAQLLLPPHGPARHGLQHRQGRGALLGGHRGGEGGGHGAGLVQAHAGHAEIEVEAGACFRGGADAIVSSNTFPSLRDRPRRRSSSRSTWTAWSPAAAWAGRDPAALAGEDGPDDARRSPTGASRGSAGSPTSRRRSPTSCSAAAPCRSAPRRCSTRRSGPNVIKRLLAGLDAFLERHAADGLDRRGELPRPQARSDRAPSPRSGGRTRRTITRATTRPRGTAEVVTASTLSQRRGDLSADPETRQMRCAPEETYRP